MINKKTILRVRLSRIWSMIVISGMMVLATACGGTVTGATGATPTTLMGYMPPEQQITNASTEMATSEPASTVDPADICSLATADEAGAVLGQAVVAMTPGSDTDNATGLTINFCTYLGSGMAVVISSVDTGSVQAGISMVQSQLSLAQGQDPTMTVTQETGIGDQAYWSVGDQAVSYTVLKGTHVFSVALGGAIGDPASHKAGMLVLTQQVAARE
jgi:hypothetical protein